MARIKRKNERTGVRIDTAEARARLPVCTKDPHWVAITSGTALGYFKGEGEGTWWLRQRVGTRYAKQRIGIADDHVKADGQVVLSHAQAVTLAVTVKLAERKPETPRHYADGRTLNDILDYYMDEHLAGRGSENITRLAINRHVRDGIGTKLVTALNADALRKWHKELVKKPPSKRTLQQREGCPKRYSEADPEKAFDPSDPDQMRKRKATANRTLTMVKAALNFAWRNDKLPADLPAFWQQVAPHPLGEEPEPRMLDQAEVKRLLNAARQDLRELLTGALMTGARYGELCALQVRDFDQEHGTVRIHQTKTGKTLLQPLTHEGAVFFDSLTAGRSPTAHIFRKADGTPWETGHATRPMKEAAAAAGLDDVSFKVTRATYGKLLLVATKDIEMVARALGHSDSRITRKHYARYLPSEVARAVAQLPALGIATDANVTRIRRNRGAK